MCTALRVPTGRRDDWRDLRIGDRVPVAKRDRTLAWYCWGRSRGDAGARLWPSGGWVDHATIKSGKWWRLNPHPVIIPCMGFEIRSRAVGLSGENWCYPEGHKAIQGALCTREGEQRVYVVTEFNEFYETKLWPRLVGYVTALVRWSAGDEMFPDEME